MPLAPCAVPENPAPAARTADGRRVDHAAGTWKVQDQLEGITRAGCSKAPRTAAARSAGRAPVRRRGRSVACLPVVTKERTHPGVKRGSGHVLCCIRRRQTPFVRRTANSMVDSARLVNSLPNPELFGWGPAECAPCKSLRQSLQSQTLCADFAGDSSAATRPA